MGASSIFGSLRLTGSSVTTRFLLTVLDFCPTLVPVAVFCPISTAGLAREAPPSAKRGEERRLFCVIPNGVVKADVPTMEAAKTATEVKRDLFKATMMKSLSRCQTFLLLSCVSKMRYGG